jgi:hypothetical protein
VWTSQEAGLAPDYPENNKWVFGCCDAEHQTL